MPKETFLQSLFLLPSFIGKEPGGNSNVQAQKTTYFSGCAKLRVPAIGPQLLTQSVYSLRTCTVSFLGVCFSEVLS